MAFADFFSRDGENIIETLEGEAREDITLVKEIHESYKEKIIKVKEIVDAWENGRNFVGFDDLLGEIKESNSRILEKIDRLIELETKEESIVKLLLARIFETGLKIQYDIKHLVGRLKENLRRFHDILINLKFIINKQDEYIKKIMADLSMIEKPAEEQLQVLEMLNGRFERVVVATLVRLMNEQQRERFSALLEARDNQQEMAKLAAEVPGLDVAIEQALLAEYEELKEGMRS